MVQVGQRSRPGGYPKRWRPPREDLHEGEVRLADQYGVDIDTPRDPSLLHLVRQEIGMATKQVAARAPVITPPLSFSSVVSIEPDQVESAVEPTIKFASSPHRLTLDDLYKVNKAVAEIQQNGYSSDQQAVDAA